MSHNRKARLCFAVQGRDRPYGCWRGPETKRYPHRKLPLNLPPLGAIRPFFLLVVCSVGTTNLPQQHGPACARQQHGPCPAGKEWLRAHDRPRARRATERAGPCSTHTLCLAVCGPCPSQRYQAPAILPLPPHPRRSNLEKEVVWVFFTNVIIKWPPSVLRDLFCYKLYEARAERVEPGIA